MNATHERPNRPNILIIMVDQLRYPQKDGGGRGLAPGIEKILSFVDAIADDNEYAAYFPGFRKLREHAVVFTDHTIAESACIPSRASIMTGQYGPRTGVTQTDGLFKSGNAQNFPWLRANGVPTLGHWFQALGYSTHYFGKWHVSDPPEHTLRPFGFDDWELSWPEPHGALPNNLGVYRDYQFADLAASFLHQRGLGMPFARTNAQLKEDLPRVQQTPAPLPFLAICSFTNPHDIAAYPTLPRGVPDLPEGDMAARFGPGMSVPVPLRDQMSNPPQGGTYRIPLNPDGFPQDCATLPATWNEDLLTNNKPTAQYEYAFKCGLGLAAKTGLVMGQAASEDPAGTFAAAVKASLAAGIPFQTLHHPHAGALGFLQYYGYSIYMVDRHIKRVLDALDESGLRDNTIVVFMADHGEQGAAHCMMMEKWHVGYQETINVPFLVSSPKFNAHSKPVAVSEQTSHIDILPTLLALTGASADQLEVVRGQIAKTHRAAPLPGADLSPIIKAPDHSGVIRGFDGTPRRGVLFVTDDRITEPLPLDDDPHNINSRNQFDVFCGVVEAVRKDFPALKPGPVAQPNHVRALRSGPWKLVRYCDPWSQVPAPDQWELYNLHADPIENVNLVVFDATFPTLIAADKLPRGLTPDEVIRAAHTLREELRLQEAALLSPYPSAYPTGA